MACPSFNIDFAADTTESCDTGLTVNFTDNSVGATSWSWDVDGDDIIDYTTQNVTHTYDDFGDFDVALTISNGSENISQVKSEYIRVGAQEISTTDITLELTLDNWPAETSWQFLDANGTVLYSGGPYVEGVDDFTTKTEVFTVNPDNCYSFIISDSFGDGICCASGNGSFRLLSDTNEELITGGDYGFGTSNNFFNGTLSVNEFTSQKILLYPNPSSSTITIKSDVMPDTYIIHNTLGQTIKKSKLSTFEDLEINVDDLSNGMYFIKVKKGESSQTLSFIKN